jgi:hypothetical protein
MPTVRNALELYQQLADWYEQRNQAQMRDRFLVLAADSALSSGKSDMAERLRNRLLQQNPHHLLKPYASFAEAMKAPDVQSYVADLRRSYSPEAAEHLLESLHSQAGEAGPTAAPPPRPLGSTAPPPAQPSEPPKESPEVLQFYRIHENLEPAKPDPLAARQVPVTRPVPRPAASPPPAPPPARKPAPGPPPAPQMPAKKPPRAPAPSPFANEPLPPTFSRVPTREEQELATGYWISTLLFVLVLLAGLALAGYTFARPFLPAEWLR